MHFIIITVQRIRMKIIIKPDSRLITMECAGLIKEVYLTHALYNSMVKWNKQWNEQLSVLESVVVKYARFLSFLNL